MNKNEAVSKDSHKTFLLLSEIEKEEKLSQRELANRLGIALGLVNSYMKNLVTKGFVRVKSFPRNRYGYLLTPHGFAEKSRLAYQHLNYFTSLYTSTRQDYLELFLSLRDKGIKEVAFCGVDEVAEIAYLSLQETGIRLTVVMDDVAFCGNEFFGMTILSLAEGITQAPGGIILSSLKRGPDLRKKLLETAWQGDIHGPPVLLGNDQ